MLDFEKTIFICMNCGAVGSSSGTECTCKKCKSKMEPTPYSSSQWIEMPTERREAAIEKWMGLPSQDRATQVEQSKNAPQQNVSYTRTEGGSSSPAGFTWIGLLRGAAYFCMFAGIFAALVFGFSLISGHQALLGFIVIVLGVLGSLIGVAGIMVFLNMADDISRIRRAVEKQNRY